MRLLDLIRSKEPVAEGLPPFIRELRDIGPVRVMRLQGNVGKEIGAEFTAQMKASEHDRAAFERPLLLDFAGTTDWDFSTVSFLLVAFGKRMAAHAKVGIINAPPELLAELRIAKLIDLFLIFDSEAEALAGLAPGK